MKSSSQNVTTSSQNPSSDDDEEDEVKITSQSTSSVNKTTINDEEMTFNINFDDFCVITAYLSVLQQEINNSTCVSPIKGINLPPPPIFLTNTPGKSFFLICFKKIFNYFICNRIVANFCQNTFDISMTKFNQLWQTTKLAFTDVLHSFKNNIGILNC